MSSFDKGSNITGSDNKLSSQTSGTKPYLSPLAAWALAFGCSVGWGAFVMPGTTFLPLAGPLGSVLGLLIGALVMLVFGLCYHNLMQRYPDEGGIYTYSKKILGSDHGFLCAWILFLTYSAVIWANSTALSLIVRAIFGNIFCFGFSYTIAGYTIYLGEILLSFTIITLTCAICIIGNRLIAWAQIICSFILFSGVAVCFVCVVIHNSGFERLKPLFLNTSDPLVQILGIVILAPWAFVGFESISHSASEFRFSVKKSLPVMTVALVTGFLSYSMLACCAALAVPDGFESWTEYISSLSTLEGISAMPTFYSAQQALGNTGLYILVASAICGILTGLMGNYVALSRLLYKQSKDGAMPKTIAKLNRFKTPYVALLLIAAISVVITFFGRTAIGWIVDVTTIGAAIVYMYVSIENIVIGKREKKIKAVVTGIIGTIIAATFFIVYLLPINSFSHLAGEDYLILAIWCILGMIVFRIILQKDRTLTNGKSGIVWIVFMFLVLMISIFWIMESALSASSSMNSDIHAIISETAASGNKEELIASRVAQYNSFLIQKVVIMVSLLTVAVSVIFSIFSTINKRERIMETKRITAEENSRAKSAFLSNMSHDIRTPMNAVTGYTALALQEENIPDNIRNYLENIDTSGKHMLGIINDILDMSRIESGKMELETAPQDIIGMLNEAELIFHHQAEVKKLAFTVSCENVNDRYVICDRHRFNRIILNLVSNACKFTPHNGRVDVTLKETKKENDLCFFTVSVKDNGIGMSPEFAEKVFDSFERERSNTVSKIQGTGLGMSITKKLVDLMDGNIRVITESGKGTEFIIEICFPAASEEEIRILKEEEKAAKSFDFSGKRLLLVEDNPINTEIAKMLLEHEGFTVETAEDGKEALDTVIEASPNHFDAVLMDIQMPVMNGYEAAMAIKNLDPPRCDIPIIAMTANTFGDDIRKASKAGMTAHISKPIEVDEMLTILMETLER